MIRLFKKNKRLKTFTYFIPAPNTTRTTGYREKELDNILHKLLNSGYKLIDLKTQAITGKQPGMWVIAIVESESDMNTEKEKHFEQFANQYEKDLLETEFKERVIDFDQDDLKHSFEVEPEK